MCTFSTGLNMLGVDVWEFSAKSSSQRGDKVYKSLESEEILPELESANGQDNYRKYRVYPTFTCQL